MKTKSINSNSMISRAQKIVILLFFTVQINPYATNFYSGIIQWTLIGLVFLLFFLRVINNKAELNNYIIWQLLFISILISSLFWTLYNSYTFGYIKNSLLILITLGYISNIIKNKSNFIDVAFMFVIAIFLNSLFIFSIIDFSSIGTSRMRVVFNGYEWNANRIGSLMAIGFFLTIIIRQLDRNKIKRFQTIVLYSVFIFLVLLSGSRQAFMLFFFMPLIYFYLLNRNKKMLIILLFLSISIISYYLIMYNPFLYNIIGMRVESLIGTIFGLQIGSSSVRYSDQVRFLMIEFGLKQFINKPFLGYGMGSYRVLAERYFYREVYSHNNYIELLVGLGIIGFLLHYSFLLNILIKAYRIRKKNTILYSFSMAIIFSILLLDFGTVSISTYYSQFLICLAFCVIRKRFINNFIS